MTRVLLRQRYEIAPRSSLGDLDPALWKSLLDELAVREIEGEKELPRLLLHPDVAPRQEDGQDIGVVFAIDVRQKALLSRKQFAATNSKHRYACIVAIAGVPDHIAVSPLHLQNDGRLLHLLEMVQHVAQFRGALEVELLGREIHPLLDPSHYFVGTSRKKEDYFVDHRAILVLRLRQDAGRFATLDVVVEARALRHLRRHVVVAAPDGEDSLHYVERPAHRSHVCIWAEVAGTVVLQPARDEYPRERLLDRHLDVGIGLIVAQSDVESRTILLDQVRFENERVRLARDDYRLEVGDEPDEVAGFRALELVVGEIAAHSGAESLCLTDVEGRPVPALPQIDPRTIGKVGKLRGNGVGNGQHV